MPGLILISAQTAPRLTIMVETIRPALDRKWLARFGLQNRSTAGEPSFRRPSEHVLRR